MIIVVMVLKKEVIIMELMAWNRVKMKDLFDEMGYRYEDTK